MYCPKCKDNFEEGSRRFCPTDGSRLISETAAVAINQQGGIFASLLPRIESQSERDETLLNVPRAAANRPMPAKPFTVPMQVPPEPAFFELDEPDIESPPSTVALPIAVPQSEADTRIVRKVQPFEIPAGHADLGGENRFPSPADDFSRANPERFVGRTVKGRYLITEFLGGDATGHAYLGDDKIVENRLVLVRILIEDGYDEIMTSILAEERVSLSHFSHPNVARLIDSGEFSNGTHFLVSEYVDALSVNDILTIHGRLDAQRVGRILRQAASAINEAHQEGIIHRDIRPENLIIDTSTDAENVKLVNFGASNGDPNEHNIGYKAPEVLEGRIATVASDIYSLGVVAYEMLTGRLPFAGGSAKELLRSQNSGLSVMPSRVDSGISPSVDEVFEKALAYNAADRYSKARDLGDALQTSLSEVRSVPNASTAFPIAEKPSEAIFDEPLPSAKGVTKKGSIISLQPIGNAAAADPAVPSKEEPNWRNRSPEPPITESSWGNTILTALGVFLLVAIIAGVWYFTISNSPALDNNAMLSGGNANSNPQVNASSTDMPPLPRTIVQPPNSNFYQNSKQNLKGDLLRNFVGFTLFYPKDWKVTGPQNGSAPNVRGKFLDISRLSSDERMQEQMLVSYYPSRGTFEEDEEKFPQLIRETNETLNGLLPNYQMVSEGEIKLNTTWRAYEVKFQGGGTSPSGENLIVWGRRIFVPAARPGARNGFEITLLATSLADGIASVDDIGVKGELATILDTFEPSQNF